MISFRKIEKKINSVHICRKLQRERERNNVAKNKNKTFFSFAKTQKSVSFFSIFSLFS
jgi:hypothetical protein